MPLLVLELSLGILDGVPGCSRPCPSIFLRDANTNARTSPPHAVCIKICNHTHAGVLGSRPSFALTTPGAVLCLAGVAHPGGAVYRVWQGPASPRRDLQPGQQVAGWRVGVVTMLCPVGLLRAVPYREKGHQGFRARRPRCVGVLDVAASLLPAGAQLTPRVPLSLCDLRKIIVVQKTVIHEPPQQTPMGL